MTAKIRKKPNKRQQIEQTFLRVTSKDQRNYTPFEHGINKKYTVKLTLYVFIYLSYKYCKRKQIYTSFVHFIKLYFNCKYKQ